MENQIYNPEAKSISLKVHKIISHSQYLTNLKKNNVKNI